MKEQNIKHTSLNRSKLHEIIFEADTTAGKRFDIVLLFAILLSVAIVMLESVPEYQEKYGSLFLVLEWIFTIFFTIEYVLRLYVVHRPIKYATSFFGVIDLLSIIPTYLTLLLGGGGGLIIIRGLRLLRVFRIFKLANFLKEGQIIMAALRNSRDKILVFISFVLVMVCIFGSIMYLVEGSQNEDFDSIPRSIYWAIVTLTTVGYGDIAPATPIGQFIASVIMILGYAIIAIPTGIVSSEIASKSEDVDLNTQSCPNCSTEGHDDNAVFCYKCGNNLHE